MPSRRLHRSRSWTPAAAATSNAAQPPGGRSGASANAAAEPAATMTPAIETAFGRTPIRASRRANALGHPALLVANTRRADVDPAGAALIAGIRAHLTPVESCLPCW